MKTLTQPIKWHGGKHYLARRIIELMPPHTHYVETHLGGGAVLLAKEFEGTSEAVNDIDGELTNFWRVLQSPLEFPKLIRRLQATPFSEKEFKASEIRAEKIAAGIADGSQLDRAICFFIRARQSRQGLMKSFATLSQNRTRRGMNEQASSWLGAIEGLPEVHDRLKRVVILDGDAEDIIRSQDSRRTLFYLDPPYLKETRNSPNAYAHEMTTEQHADLLELLSRIKGKFILSGYPSGLYDKASRKHKWRKEKILIDNKASSKAKKEIKTECLWLNY